MALPLPTYLTDEYYNWNGLQSKCALLKTLGNNSKVGFKWEQLTGSDRVAVHDLIMKYAIQNALVEATALTLTTANAWQVINVGGAGGAAATGLANDATVYTATAIITNTGVETTVPITVTGSAAQTFTLLAAAINTDVIVGTVGTSVVDPNGNVKVSSNVADNTSTVELVDVDLFKSLTGFAGLETPLHGVSELREIFDLNLIHNNPYSTKYSGLIHTVAIAPGKSAGPIDKQHVYFDHFAAVWKYSYNDVTVV